jgi:hypothetical protein
MDAQVMGSEATAAEHQRLTWTEICDRYPDRWVVVADTDWVNETDFEFRSAEVIACHRRRKDASPDVKAVLARGRPVGCFWTGEIRGPVPRFIP